MTDNERIEQLEKRVAYLETALSARVDAALGVTAISSGVAIDALALLAVLDRGMVEYLIRVRRLSHQNAGSSELTAELLKRYEMALEQAERLSSSRPLGPAI